MFFAAQSFLSILFLLAGSQYAYSDQQLSTLITKNKSSSTLIIETNPQQHPFLKIVQAPAENSLSTLSTCKKADFESVVDKAAGVLRDLNFKNKPHFQDKLKELKEKRGWSDTDFEKEAPRFVKDDEIDRLDTQTLDLLAKITAMGNEGSSVNLPDCSLLETLQKYMQDLIDTQTAKWAYMFQKIDTETNKEQ